MSTFNKVKWVVFLLLIGLIWWLVVVDFVRNDRLHVIEAKNELKGLKCVSNCGYFYEVTR